jgi:hypothetical protein
MGERRQAMASNLPPPGHKFSGQNLRAYAAVMQWLNGKIEIVSPSSLKTSEPRLPAPANWPLAVK